MLRLVEQVVAPGDRGSQGALPGRRVSAAGEDWKVRFEPLRELRGTRAPRPRRRQLQRKREAVEPLADSANGGTVAEAGVHVTGTLDEEGGGIVERERFDAVLAFAPDAERDPARCEHCNVLCAPRKTHDGRSRLEQVLEVVEHEQQPLPFETLLELGCVTEREHIRDCSGHEVGITERREVDEVDAVAEVVDHARSRLDREPRLPGAAGARQRDEPRPPPDQVDDLFELTLATDNRRRLRGQVRVRRRLLRDERLTEEVEETLSGRCQRHAACAQGRDRSSQPPPRHVEDDQPSGLELEVERQPADRCDPGTLGDRELDGFPGLELERGDGVKSELPPRSLDGCSCRRALFPGEPGEPFELLRTQPPSTERRRTDQDDLVLHERLALELRRDGHAADHGELDPMEPHELERPRGRSLLELDLDARVALAEPRRAAPAADRSPGSRRRRRRAFRSQTRRRREVHGGRSRGAPRRAARSPRGPGPWSSASRPDDYGRQVPRRARPRGRRGASTPPAGSRGARRPHGRASRSERSRRTRGASPRFASPQVIERRQNMYLSCATAPSYRGAEPGGGDCFERAAAGATAGGINHAQ